MKRLVWKIILPITIITFSFFTKWWYVLPIDAPDTMMSGFPLIWLSEGWHTSLSLQIFVSELILNLLIFFIFWVAVFLSINRFIIEIKIPKILTTVSYIITGLICILALLIGTMEENTYKVKRDFKVEVLTTGYKFIWQNQTRPKYEDYKHKIKRDYNH